MGMVGGRGAGRSQCLPRSRSGVNWQSPPPQDLLKHSPENPTYLWVVIFYLYTSQRTKLTSDTQCSLNWTSCTNVWNINFIRKAFHSSIRSYNQSLHFFFILNTIKIRTFHSFDTYLGTYQYQALGTQVKQEDPWSYGAYILAGRQYFFFKCLYFL